MSALTLAALAFGADLVLHAGDPAVAVGRAAAAAGVDPATLRAADLSEVVRARPPVLLGPGQVDQCAGTPTTNAEVRLLGDEGERALNYLEYARAAAALERAFDALGCLIEPVEPPVAARILFLRGVAGWFAGDPDAARAAFAQALLFDPSLAWDEAFAPDPRPLFDEVAASDPPTAPLRVVPPSARVRVDGVQAEALAPGVHLVQVGEASVSTVRVRLDAAEPSVLVLPSLVPLDALGWAADPARAPDLAAVLDAVLGEDARVYVVHAGEVWREQAGTWERIALPPPPPPRARWALVGPGAAAAVGGAILGTVSTLNAHATAERYAADPLPYQERDALYDRYGRQRTAAIAGWAVTGAGVAVAGAGLVPLVVTSDGVRVQGRFR